MSNDPRECANELGVRLTLLRLRVMICGMILAIIHLGLILGLGLAEGSGLTVPYVFTTLRQVTYVLLFGVVGFCIVSAGTPFHLPEPPGPEPEDKPEEPVSPEPNTGTDERG